MNPCGVKCGRIGKISDLRTNIVILACPESVGDPGCLWSSQSYQDDVVSVNLRYYKNSKQQISQWFPRRILYYC